MTDHSSRDPSPPTSDGRGTLPTPTGGRVHHVSDGWPGTIVYGPDHGMVRVQWDAPLPTTEFVKDVVFDGASSRPPVIDGDKSREEQ